MSALVGLGIEDFCVRISVWGISVAEAGGGLCPGPFCPGAFCPGEVSPQGEACIPMLDTQTRIKTLPSRN